jgi:DNA-binding beta-propeller fold protein YncE
MKPFFAAALCAAAIALMLGGCAEVPPAEDQGPETVFYPPLPNPPRIQYLASFSGEADLARDLGSFGNFILGDDADVGRAVKKPYGVALYDDTIYVADTRGSGLGVFDLRGQRFDVMLGSGGGAMLKPINVTIDADGSKFVTDTDKNQVLLFDAANRFVRAYGTEGQFKPGDVAIVDGKLYVSDLSHHNIQVLDKNTGELISTFGKVGSKEGELYFPTNLALGPLGHLYVSDTGNFRIQKFTLDGKFLNAFGSVGTGIGQFARPKGIAVDREGRIYVVDAAFENVQILDPEGKVLLFFGEPGSNHPAGFNLPTDIFIDYTSVPFFQQLADPGFKIEYVILVANQFGRAKLNVFGFGKMAGMDYSVGQ